jgi:hypothetical protein
VPLITAVSGSNVLPGQPPSRVPPTRPTPAPRWIPVDASTGARYYYDTLTGASSWDAPNGAAELAPAPTREPTPAPTPAPERVSTNDLSTIDEPKAWKIYATREGRPYYVHAASGTTTWDIPRALSLNPLRLLECEPLVPARAASSTGAGVAHLNALICGFAR